MLDAQAITGMIQSFQAITNITKSLIGLHDDAVTREAVSKLQGEVLSAQASALAFQAEYAKTFDRIRELEKEVTDLRAWESEKHKYQLSNIGIGNKGIGVISNGKVLAYTLKQPSETEPFYFLCTNCFEDHTKSVLQQETRTGLARVLVCHRCGLDLYLAGERHPDHPGGRKTSRR